MIERSILFSGENAIAILDRRKTQTRRVMKLQPPDWVKEFGYSFFTPDDYISGRGLYNGEPAEKKFKCPYGMSRDRLIFKTTWAVAKDYDQVKPSRLPSTINLWSYFSGTPKPEWCGRSRPSRFLPKKLFYLMPQGEIVNIRVERVQAITEEDAKAEGAIKAYPVANECEKYSLESELGTYRAGFCALWDSINAKRGYGWDVNPWVRVIEFKML